MTSLALTVGLAGSGIGVRFCLALLEAAGRVLVLICEKKLVMSRFALPVLPFVGGGCCVLEPEPKPDAFVLVPPFMDGFERWPNPKLDEVVFMPPFVAGRDGQPNPDPKPGEVVLMLPLTIAPEA